MVGISPHNSMHINTGKEYKLAIGNFGTVVWTRKCTVMWTRVVDWNQTGPNAADWTNAVNWTHTAD